MRGRQKGTPRTQSSDLLDWGELTLTHRCNQRCFFCYEDGRDVAKEPPLEEVKRILDEQAKHAQLISLCGKEALLRKDILEVIRYGKSLGVDISVFTNGQRLAREGLVEELAEAGCDSLSVSFHFPDAATFARGARVSAKMYPRILRGLRNVRDYNRRNPKRALLVSTETDLYALNAGRLKETRATLLEALGDTGWEMRLACLVPTQVHDIGLDRLLEPLAERREELAEFIRTHPDGVPLRFVKIPLCLLPRGEEHRALGVQYFHRKTVLTFNHAQVETIEGDPWSTTQGRDLEATLRTIPYRWVCRTCPLVSLCRFERTRWDFEHFKPGREDRFEPPPDTSPRQVLDRLGPAPKAVAGADAMTRAIEKVRFPEEDLLDSLAQVAPGAPELLDAWAEEHPILTVLLGLDGHRVQLRLNAPSRMDGRVALGAVVGYLDVQPIDADLVPPDILHRCIQAFAPPAQPRTEAWAEDTWFDPHVAQLYQRAWRRFGRRIWPGLGQIGEWRAESAAVDNATRLLVSFVHPTGLRGDMVYEGPAAEGFQDREPYEDTRVTFSLNRPLDERGRRACQLLLGGIGRLASGAPVRAEAFPRGATSMRARLTEGVWRIRRLDGEDRRTEPTHATGGAGELRVSVELADSPPLVFHIAPYRAGQPHFARVDDTILWYSHSHGGAPTPLVLRVLNAAMTHHAPGSPSPESVELWSRTIATLFERVGLTSRLDWTAEWAD